MKEQYYLIPKSKFTLMIDKYGDWDNVDENQDIVNGINELIKDCPLVDLSDSAIEEAVDLDSSKVRRYDDGFDRKKGYRAALKNLKNKLNGNK